MSDSIDATIRSLGIKPSFERTCNAKNIECPVCGANIGQQCRQIHNDLVIDVPGPNHIERARQERWEMMGVS